MTRPITAPTMANIEKQPFGESQESLSIRAIENRILPRHYFVAVSRQLVLYPRFYRLLSQWRRDIGAQSSTTAICTHPAYQQIIGMGETAVPFILRELERKPDLWFWALKAITGEDPVPKQNQGRVREMAKDWLLWAVMNGYTW